MSIRWGGTAVAALFVAAALLSPRGSAAQVVDQQRSVVVDSIAVEGNVRLSQSEVIGAAGIRTDVPISPLDVQRAVKELWATREFRDVEVHASGGTGSDDPIVLTYRVDEQDLITSVDILGLENVDAGTVQDTADLHAGQPYAPQRVERAKRFIRQELSRQGIPFARIEERRSSVPGEEKRVGLVLDVEEGNRVAIADVEFEGNDVFPEGSLVGALSTKPEGFWWFRDGSYDPERFQQDLAERLPEFYRARGYLDFEVLGDTLLVDPQTGKARARVTVEEGRQYRVADFVIEGNREFPTERLQQYFTGEQQGLLQRLGFGGDDGGRDPVFDQTAFREATQRVQQLYSNNGYLYAEVRPFVEPLESEGDDAPRVRVGWQIQEGNPAYVNRVVVEGNDYTYERVIRDQILLLPGDVYSEERLIQSYQSIQSLGFFQSPMDVPEIEPDPETGDVDIVFQVEEQQTGSVNFGTAVGGGTGLSGFLGYDQPNLFGQAKEGHLRWDYGNYINSFTASFSDPALLGSRISGSFSVFNSTDRFFQFDTGRRKRLGASTRFGIPTPWSRFTRVFLGYSLSRTEYRAREGVDDLSLFGREPGTQSAVSLGVTRSTLNHPIFPTQGSQQRVEFEFNGGPLGGDGDFVKQTLEGTWWVPVGSFGGDEFGVGGPRFALGLKIRAGAIYGDATNFPFEQFWMGGVQFGEQLRGYGETSVTPLGYFPERSGAIPAIQRLGDSFMQMSAEYALRLNNNISLSAFYEAGNLWQDPLEANPTQLFRGAGVGVQLVTPFGPLGLDYAYGFDKPDPGWEFHFRMGPGF